MVVVVATLLPARPRTTATAMICQATGKPLGWTTEPQVQPTARPSVATTPMRATSTRTPSWAIQASAPLTVWGAPTPMQTTSLRVRHKTTVRANSRLPTLVPRT